MTAAETVWDDAYENWGEGEDLSEFAITGRIRYGTHLGMEELADRILFGHLRTITSRRAKSDVLTPWKIKDRIAHEVYTNDGVPDSSIRQGMYHRVLNRAQPHLNSRDGIASAMRNENTVAMKYLNGTHTSREEGPVSVRRIAPKGETDAT
jgi:hypothetical protein